MSTGPQEIVPGPAFETPEGVDTLPDEVRYRVMSDGSLRRVVVYGDRAYIIPKLTRAEKKQIKRARQRGRK